MRVAFLYNESDEDPAGLAEDGDPERSPIVAALRSLGHEVTALACTFDLAAVRRQIERARPEIAFNRVESLGGSDALAAAIPLLLDTLRLPYTGCSTGPMLATTNKLTVKERLAAARLPTPRWVDGGEVGAGRREQGAGSEELGARRNQISSIPCSTLHVPRFILKSVLEHASFAIDDASIIPGDDLGHVVELVRECESRFRRPYYAEEFIEGREFNLAVLGDEPTVLPPAEIDFSAFPVGKPRIIGRVAKFDADSFEYENTPRRYDFPESDQPLIRQLTELAAECWRLFDLAGYARVDFRVDADNQPWILEINANPCPAPDSGFAAAAAEAGIDFEGLIERILVDALERSGRPNLNHREPQYAHAFAR